MDIVVNGSKARMAEDSRRMRTDGGLTPPYDRGMKRLRTAFFAVCGVLVLALSGCEGLIKDFFDGVNNDGSGNKIPSYSVAVLPSVNAYVSASPKTAEAGTSITLTVNPDDGYSLTGLTVSNAMGGAVSLTSLSPPYTFKMPAANVKVSAVFKVGEAGDGALYRVTIEQAGHGSVSATSGYAVAGTEITLTATANEGYQYTAGSLSVSSGETTVALEPGNGDNIYTFMMPEADVTVTAEFVPIPFSGTSGDTDSVIDKIRAAADGDSPLTITLAAGNEAVTLTDETDLGTAGLVLTHGDTSPAVVIIDGGGRVVDLTGMTKGSLITVGAGVKLKLRNITFKGLDKTNNEPGDDDDNSAPVITVASGGYLILEDDALITGNYNAAYGGGGVRVDYGGTFTMNGGTVSNNTAGNDCGGGVHMKDGNFTMNGGTVSNNTAVSHGGGVYAYYGTFTMRGGSVSGNKTTEGNGGGVYVGSGGTFKKNGGTIYGSYGGSLQNDAYGYGDAAYAETGSKCMDDTAGPGVVLDSGDDANWE